MDKPVICAMNGSAAGYGLDLALGCDIRIMSQEAKMAAAYVKRGIVPESGGTWFLPRLLGWSKAAEIIFTGRTLPADECLKLGLVSHVVPPEEVMPSALSLAQEIGANAPWQSSSQKTYAYGMGGAISYPRSPRIPSAPSPCENRRFRRGGKIIFREKAAQVPGPLIHSVTPAALLAMVS